MKKSTDSWYKNKTWNGDIDTRFEKQLRYTRNPIHKAEYLLVQGSLLLNNPNQNIQEVGLVLLSRLIEGLPTEHSPILTAQEKLGDYYFNKQLYQQAAEYYKIVMEYCVQQQSRTNTSLITDLKWAESMLHMNLVEQFEKAYQLVQHYPKNILQSPANKFYYAELGALLCERMYKKTEAINFAREAIELSVVLKSLPSANKSKSADAAMANRVQKLNSIIEGVEEGE